MRARQPLSARRRVVTHRFLVCRTGRQPVVWRPPVATDGTGHDITYMGRMLAVASDLLSDHPGLTFVLTWDLDRLPEVGQHVVAVVQGDEDARIPRWSNDVLCTFKCYGTRPPWMPPAPRPGLVEALELAHFVRRAARWAPGAVRRVWGGGHPLRPRPPIDPIPLGYYNQDDIPEVRFAERRWSVSFAGSGLDGAHRGGWRGIVGTPRDRNRRHMHRELLTLSKALPDEPIFIMSQPGFPTLFPGQDRLARELTQSYSELLAHTKLCLVPRGYSPETFRFFEALRAGCVVVCEHLPDHWFYRGAPVVRIRQWSELGVVVPGLLGAPRHLEDLHRASVEWWETRCSEGAVGRFVAQRVRSWLAQPR